MIYIPITFKGNSSSTRLRNPIRLNGEPGSYEIGVVSASFYNSIQNIVTGVNDQFVYSTDGGVSWSTVTIPSGAYEIDQINDQLQQGLGTESDPLIEIVANFATLRSEIVVDNTAPDVQVDFTGPQTFRELLGFNSQILSGSSRYVSDEVANIENSVSLLRFTCSLARGAINNGDANTVSEESQVVFSTTRQVNPGFRQTERPSNIIYLPMNTNVISDIQVNFIDQRGQLLPMPETERSELQLLIRKAAA